jgi:hypothetical protein
MKIIGINYNWYCVDENGEQFTNRWIGENYIYGNGLKVTEINEHAAQGEGDRWCYDIHYSDGSMERIFHPNQVFFTKD